jgi:hypothetical protein
MLHFMLQTMPHFMPQNMPLCLQQHARGEGRFSDRPSHPRRVLATVPAAFCGGLWGRQDKSAAGGISDVVGFAGIFGVVRAGAAIASAISLNEFNAPSAIAAAA